MKVVFSPRALDRIVEIESHLVEVGAKAKATRVVAAFKSKARLLSTMPRMGRVVPEIGDPNLRELIIAPYRLVYEVRDELQLVEVHTVVHSKQQFPVDEFLDD